MQQFLMILSLVQQLFPMVIAIVKQVEEAFPEGGQGAVKLAMVRSALETAFRSYTEAQVTFDKLWPTLKIMIDGAVAIYNATGKFKKSS